MISSLDPRPPLEGGKAWYRLFAHVQYYPKNLYLRIFSIKIIRILELDNRILSMNKRRSPRNVLIIKFTLFLSDTNASLSLEFKQQDGTQLY